MEENRTDSYPTQETESQEKLIHGTWRAWIHPNWEIILKTVLIGCGIHIVFRLLFLLKYSSLFSGTGFWEGTAAFLHGIRFDLSTVFTLYGVLFLVVLTPGVWNQTSAFRSALRIAILVLSAFQIMILYIDLQYYGYVNRHLSSELAQILNDLGAMISLAFTSYLLPILGYIIFLVLFWFLLKLVFRKRMYDKMRLFDKKTRTRYFIIRPVLNIILFLLLAVLAVRGGIQTKPLRISHAFTSDRIILGHFSLNGLFTVIKAMYKPGAQMKIPISYENAAAEVLHLLEDEHSKFSHPDYPVLREHIEVPAPGNPANVVLLIMESWTANMIGALGNNEKLTPVFDNLAENGVLCSNFYAVGQRSKDAIVSILYSFPTFNRLSVVGKVHEQNNMIGLGNILKTYHYTTRFYCGAKRGSMGFDFITAKAGYDSYISREDFELPKTGYDGTWGVFDEHTFTRAAEEFAELQEPFLGTVFSLHPHEPYSLPSPEFRKKEGEHSGYKNTLFYSDWVLGKFFKAAEQHDYFKNTLFIIVADHAEGNVGKTILNSFHIPCLFYYPGKLKPAVLTEPASQLDIIPTILDILDIRATHASFGTSIFGTAERSALISYGSVLGWLKNGHILLHNTEKTLGFYNYSKDPLLADNLYADSGILPSLYEKELLGKVKLAAVLLRENRIAPLNTKHKIGK